MNGENLERDIDTAFDWNEESTRVKTVLIMPGNCGCNNAARLMAQLDPDKVPGFHIVVLDADAQLLRERFLKPPLNVAGRRLRKWFEKRQLDIVKLEGKRQPLSGNAPVKTRKWFGAGGNQNVGKGLFESSLPRIMEIVANADFVFLVGAGGGGIGAAVLSMMAAKLNAEGVSFNTILTTPFISEGDKFAKANELRLELREKGPLVVVPNEGFPLNDNPNATEAEVWAQIYDAYRPIFSSISEFTQEVGTTSNVDLADIMRAGENMKDASLGNYDVPDYVKPEAGGVYLVDVEEVVKKLLHGGILVEEIHASRLLFGFKGGWSKAQQTEVKKRVQEGLHFPINGLVKCQVREDTEEMGVSFIAYGNNDEDAVETNDTATETPALTERPTLSPATTQKVAGTKDELKVREASRLTPKKLHEKYGTELKKAYLQVNRSLQGLDVPPLLNEEWRMLVADKKPSREKYGKLLLLWEDFTYYGPQPDIPADYRLAKILFDKEDRITSEPASPQTAANEEVAKETSSIAPQGNGNITPEDVEEEGLQPGVPWYKAVQRLQQTAEGSNGQGQKRTVRDSISSFKDMFSG